jgi:hypothetical protein
MTTYKIVRMYWDETENDHLRVIKEGLTLDEAQAHCQRDDTHAKRDGLTVWFDGYEKEIA